MCKGDKEKTDEMHLSDRERETVGRGGARARENGPECGIAARKREREKGSDA